MDHLVTLDIPAKGDYVVLCRLALAGLLRNNGFSEDAVADLKLAITEACTNSIRHAYPDGDETGTVHLAFQLDDDRLVLVVEDNGAGFVDEAACEPSGLNDGAFLLSESGMGIAIIRAVVDDFQLEHPSLGGTRLTLTKRCDA